MFDKNILNIPGIGAALAVAALVSLVQAALVIGQAAGLSLAIVGVWEGATISQEIGWVAMFFACFILWQAAASFTAWHTERFATRAAAKLRAQLLESTYDMGPEGVRAFGSAVIVATIIEGIDLVQDYITIIVPKMTSLMIVPAVLVIAIFCLDWVSGIIALVCFPFIILFMVLIGSTANEEATGRYKEFERMSNSFTDTANCIPTLKAFGANRDFSARIYEASERFRELTMKTLRVAMLSSSVLDMFATLSLAAVAIMLGFRMVDGVVAFLPALMVLILMPEYFKPVREFGEDYHATLDGKNALISIQEIRAYEAQPREFLKGIDLHVGSASNVGIFGRSGAGKSTLMNVLSGFAQDEGVHLYVDDVEVETASQAWRDRVAFIPQTPYLFNTTLRENLRFYAPDASDERISEALRRVGLDSFVLSLPEKLDTVIGQGGMQMSGGQAQRIAVARALLDPARDVWILDEPTAHLDIETEYELKEQLLPLMEGRLVFFGTHRMHWADQMDQAIFLEDGLLCDSGPKRRPKPAVSAKASGDGA